MKKYFKVKISYERKDVEMQSVKRIVENFLFNCNSVDEAKTIITEALSLLSYSDVVIESISKSNVGNFVNSDNDGKFYKCTMVFIAENDETGALRKIKEVFVVKAATIEDACKVFKENYVKGSLSECFLRSVSEMNIIDVL